MSYALVIDVETTGLSPQKNQLLTLGLVLIDKNNNTIAKQEELIIKPNKAFEISKIAMQINKIDIKNNFKNGITYEEVIIKLSEYHNYKYNCIIGHNLGFDIRFLQEYLQDEFQRFLCNSRFEHIDTMKMLKESKHYKGKNCKLQTACDYYNIKFDNAHNALSDCIATSRLFKQLSRSEKTLIKQ